ncbi:MAG: GNAT family N-acetyltransferase [Eubacterium sp.]|nr:GNAT family N-acetyltransferase [Eubacterium sp.]
MFNTLELQVKVISTFEIENSDIKLNLDSIGDNNIQLSTQYLQILSSNLKNDFNGYYAIAIYRDEVIAWTYFFIDKKFSFQGILFGIYERLYRMFPIKLNTAFISAPIAEYNIFRVKNEYLEYEDFLVGELIEAVVGFVRQKKVSMIIVRDQIKQYTSKYIKNNFTHFHFMPGTIINLQCNHECDSRCNITCEHGCDCFNTYLSGLKKKWRGNIRNKINRQNKDLVVEVIPASQLSEKQNERCYSLYLQTIEKQHLKHEYLSETYFSACAQNLDDRCKMLIAHINENIIGFAQLLENSDSVINVRMGMDYSCAKEFQLYYHLLYENIRYSLRKKKKYLYTSQTCYRPKLEVGAQLLPLHTYIRLCNPILNKIIGKIIIKNCSCYSELIESDNPTKVLEQYKLSSY